MTNPVSPIPQHRPVLSRFHLRAEQARQNFYIFVQQAWHVLEPQTPSSTAFISRRSVNTCKPSPKDASKT
jgi:hypothetical protein